MKPFITSWTKLSTFEKCPMLFYLQYGSKHLEGKELLPFVENEWTRKGSEIHAEMEENLRKCIDTGWWDAPKGKHWQAWWTGVCHKFLDYPGKEVEMKFGITNTGEGVELGDYYKPTHPYGGDIWIQGAFDFVGLKDDLVHIVDWKSGKYRPAGLEYGQLAMYALAAFYFWPHANRIKTTYAFLEQQKAQTLEWSRIEDFEKLKKDFSRRIQKVHEALDNETFLYNGQCDRWCPATPELCERKR